MNEIIFNDKGNYTDFETILNYFKPQPPQQKVITEEIPFMSGNYDFSTIGSNGEVVFTQRKINCSIQYAKDNSGRSMILYSQLLEWLLSGKHELIYTGEPDMKYMARVEDVASFDFFNANDGTLTFTFTADPFKQGVTLVGADIWDTFNFEVDYSSPVSFEVTNSQAVIIYNPGRAVMPTINASTAMTLTCNNKTYNLITGDNKFYDLSLQTGANNVIIAGTGTISFIFRKQVL